MLGAIDVMEKIYLDSCLVIYLVERHPLFYPVLHNLVASRPNAVFAVSELTRLEVLTRPLRDGDRQLVQRFEVFLQNQESLPIDDTIVRAALDLRVAGLKTPDALHVALARHYACTALWTNDDRLSKILPGWSDNVLRGLKPE
jgi:predicted nucleic acid-binding protein